MPKFDPDAQLPHRPVYNTEAGSKTRMPSEPSFDLHVYPPGASPKSYFDPDNLPTTNWIPIGVTEPVPIVVDAELPSHGLAGMGLDWSYLPSPSLLAFKASADAEIEKVLRSPMPTFEEMTALWRKSQAKRHPLRQHLALLIAPWLRQ